MQPNPADIQLPPGFAIEVFAEGLTAPINLVFDEQGDLFVADAGVADGNGKVLRLTAEGFRLVADGFNPPLTGINVLDGDIYVAHRGFVTVVGPDGRKRDIIARLPSLGDHHNNRVVFGPDGKMYFGQGTATNSGVVGKDNPWVMEYPFFHDYPGQAVMLTGQTFTTDDFWPDAGGQAVPTGAFVPFGEPSYPGQIINGVVRASGSILRANPDGSELELVCWGLRNPFRIKFDRHQRLFASNHSYDVRGSRPVNNAPDEFHLIRPGIWYGWPDFVAGAPINLPMFKAEGQPQPQPLLARHPMQPPRPLAVFQPHSAAMGFDFNPNPAFGPLDDVFIAEFGPGAPVRTGGQMLPMVGHRVSHIDLRTGRVTDFAINRSGVAASATGGGGFERPIDVVFGPDGLMYIADFGIFGETSAPGTGVIWRVRPA